MQIMSLIWILSCRFTLHDQKPVVEFSYLGLGMWAHEPEYMINDVQMLYKSSNMLS